MSFLKFPAVIREDERRQAAGAFLTLFGFMAGHALLETARDALFLARLPASQLPWVYLMIAVIALVLTQIQQRSLRRFGTGHELSVWLSICSAITLVFWALIGQVGTWVFYALYVWSGLLATLVVIRFWTVLANLFTVTQAKRLFAFVGSGSVMGAIAGSALARLLAETLAPRHLVLSAAAVLLLSSLGPRFFHKNAEPSLQNIEFTRGWDVSQIFQLVWGRPYLRRVATLLLVSTVTFTLVDYVFKSSVGRFVAPGQLDEFFSTVYLGLNVLSLLAQLALVPWLLRRFGVSVAHTVVPGLLLLAAGGFVVGGGLSLALLLKGIDGSLRHSLHRTGTELLFVSLSEEVRGRVKAFIDVIGQRGGQALASVFILTTLIVTAREFVFALVILLTCGIWLVLAKSLKKHYLDVFRETLSADITHTRIAFPALDLASLETLVSTLDNPDDRKVLAALDLLVAQGKVAVIPALILYHPSSAVVIHALELFAQTGRVDFLATTDRLLSHPDPEIRAASLRVRSRLRPQESELRSALADPSAAVRATALAGLVSGRWLSRDKARKALQEVLNRGPQEAQVALAKAICSQPSEVFAKTLMALAGSSETEVQLEVVRAMREVGSLAFLSPLVKMLGDRVLRHEVRKTLVAMGPEVLSQLDRALKDTALPRAVRWHLPQTIACFAPGPASQILLSHLLDEKDGMIRYRLLRALGRLRAENPNLQLDKFILDRALEEAMSGAFSLMGWRRALVEGSHQDPSRTTAVYELLVTLLRDKQIHALERLFRLLNLRYHNEDFKRIHRGLWTTDPKTRAGSRELLENLVPPDLRESLLILVDDLDESTVPTSDASASERSYQPILRILLESNSESLSCLAAYHIAELGLVDLEDSLRALKPGFSDFHADVIDHTLRKLSSSREREAEHG